MTANVKSTRRSSLSSHDVHSLMLTLGAGALLFAALGGCTRAVKNPDEMQWAKAALERNERLQVVASDPQARTFTVRVKESGELHIVPVDQLVAGPAGIGTAGAGVATGAAGAAQTSTAAAENALPPPAAETAGTVAPSAESSGTQETRQSAPQGGADSSKVAAAGESATSDTAATPAEMRAPRAETAANAKPGRVLASGPGYSIKATGPRGNTPRVATVARGVAVERLHDPIICQGSRLLHIDNRNLEFDGDAVSAEDGCELHITNTHISAKGIGVLARAANVHIENSEIEGDSGAIDASDGAQVYAEASRFKGLTRRLARSSFHDLGGNVWN